MVENVIPLKPPELERDPHIVLPTLDGNVHVIPVIVFERFVAGEEGEYPDKLALRSVVNDWLNLIGASTCASKPDPEDRGPAPDNVVSLKR